MIEAHRHHRPPILDAVLQGGDAILEASAGTGKTFTIESLVVELLLRGAATIDQIVVVTFTMKATAELRSRVRARIASLLEPPVQAAATDESYWTIDAQARTRLEAALYAFDAAPISTIHAFCQRLLGEHAFANRRLFDEQPIDEGEAFTRAFRHVLRSCWARDPAFLPWLRAWLARKNLDALDALLRRCVKERGALRPIFDARAVEAALDEVPIDAASRDLIAREGAKLHAGTRKAIDWRLRELFDALERWQGERDLPLALDRIDALRSKVIPFLADKLGAGASPREAGRAASALPAGHSDAARPASTRMAASLAALDAAAPPFEAAVAQTLLPPLRARIDAWKRERGRFDFDDMLRLVDESLSDANPQREALLAALRARWRFALVDESQDTDEVQWRIFQRIFLESGGQSRLFLVGDPKQAIYRFRGAEVMTYVAARAAIGRVVPLAQNFRSTPALIDAVNAILDPHAPAPFFPATSAIRYDAAVTSGKPSLAAVDGSGTPVAPITLLRLIGEGVKLSAATVASGLGAAIAHEIRRVVDNPAALRFDGAAIRHKDVHVLARTKAESLRVGEALRAAGVPYAYHRADGLFQTPEAQDIRDLLAAVDDPRDASRRARAWLTPFFGLRLAELPRCRDLPPTHPLLARLFEWKALADARAFSELFARILGDSGIARRALAFVDSERALTNTQHLFELLLEEAVRSRPTLRELLSTLRAYVEGKRLPFGEDANVQRIESERDAVQILTMHKAKGLEAAVVFVAGGFTARPRDALRLLHEEGHRTAWLGTPPAAQAAAMDREEEEEERRLLYVAITRAKACLYLPYVGPPPPGATRAYDAALDAWGKLLGPYRHVNQRLVEMVRTGGAALEVRDVPCPAAEPLEADARHEAATAARLDWTPPPPARAAARVAAEIARLREGREGFVISSYTQMRAAAERALPRRARQDVEGDDFAEPARSDDDELQEPDDADDLPGGRETGTFLHEVLERIALSGLADRAVDAWRDDDEVRKLFAASAAAHGVEARHIPRAQTLVHRALTSPIALGARRLASFASLRGAVREMEFVFPIPEADGWRLSLPQGDTRVAIGRGVVRGFVRGFVDLVFQHDGLAYFADWKSDRLPAWHEDRLREHVERHYADQATLYTLALVKMLGVRGEADYEARFGGLVYCFLRGMRGDGDGRDGVHFARPPFATVLAWEQELAAHDWSQA